MSLLASAAVAFTLTVSPSATTDFGGLNAREAAGRSYFAVDARSILARTGRVRWEAGIATSTHVWHSRRISGVGVIPAGAVLRLSDVWELALHGGVWHFADEIPVPGARQLTLTGQLELRLRVSQTVSIGAAFYHASNAKTGRVNPGLNMIAATLHWRVR